MLPKPDEGVLPKPLAAYPNDQQCLPLGLEPQKPSTVHREGGGGDP